MGLMHVLDKIEEMIGGEEEVVVKTIPMKKEWLKSSANLDAMCKKRKELEEQYNAERSKMWAQIKLDLNDFTTHFVINDKTKELQFMGPKNQEKLIKSPLSEI